MESLSQELRGVIEKRVRAASPQEVLTIASALCTEEPVYGMSFTSSQPLARFETRGDVVLDRRTGLMWSRENLPGGRMNWAAAKQAAEKCALAGYTDWRLPSIRELLSLVDYERHEPAIDTTVFKCDAAWYWSSTPLASSPGGCAWFVNFGYGSANWDGQDGGGFVRACRPGQSVEHWF